MPPQNPIRPPPSHSTTLTLSHPTPSELTNLWILTAPSWSDALPLPTYLSESHSMTSAPLARNTGLTPWILVSAAAAPDHRAILSSCETIRKSCLFTCPSKGKVAEGVVHGVASVFTPEQHRGCGYAARMMRELALVLWTWQVKQGQACVGSILYSDIGPAYYAKLGWRANPTNAHIELPARVLGSRSPLVRWISDAELDAVCARDEALLWGRLGGGSSAVEEEEGVRFGIVPDAAHMRWHHAKADFACRYLFDAVPGVKGAAAGRVWALWTHRYYVDPALALEARKGGVKNVLYVLRLGVDEEKECVADTTACLRAVLRAAQTEAVQWKLDVVQIWDPSTMVRDVLENMVGIQFESVERDEGLASVLWYDKHGNVDASAAPIWVNNEYYAWL